MKHEYDRKPARDIVPGDMIFNVKTRRPVAVDTAFGCKELVLVAK
jgi:hypothetical protein|nr:MAG TPA: hypothetical protein [Caudoviricetes sp.]